VGVQACTDSGQLLTMKVKDLSANAIFSLLSLYPLSKFLGSLRRGLRSCFQR